MAQRQHWSADRIAMMDTVLQDLHMRIGEARERLKVDKQRVECLECREEMAQIYGSLTSANQIIHGLTDYLTDLSAKPDAKGGN